MDELLGWSGTHLPLPVILMRLGLAALFGAAIGFEREVHNKGAGLRTHIFISLAAALYATIAWEIFERVQALDSNANADPIRAVEAVTAGIAFLGAGMIFRSANRVKGLTTGAGMWLAGAVGVACAFGYYVIAFAVTLLAVLVLGLVLRMERRFLPDGEDAPSDSDSEAEGGGERRS